MAYDFLARACLTDFRSCLPPKITDKCSALSALSLGSSFLTPFLAKHPIAAFVTYVVSRVARMVESHYCFPKITSNNTEIVGSLANMGLIVLLQPDLNQVKNEAKQSVIAQFISGEFAINQGVINDANRAVAQIGQMPADIINILHRLFDENQIKAIEAITIKTSSVLREFRVIQPSITILERISSVFREATKGALLLLSIAASFEEQWKINQRYQATFKFRSATK